MSAWPNPEPEHPLGSPLGGMTGDVPGAPVEGVPLERAPVRSRRPEA